MSLYELPNRINFNFRRKIFRREAETSFYSKKKFRIPQVNYVSADTIDRFRQNYPFRFWENMEELRKYSEILKTIEPQEEIIEHAGKILENRYNLFGQEEEYLGNKINWHFDYKGRYEWQRDLSWRSNFFDFPKGAEIKYPWELARFHQGLTLGKAYLLTGDEKYTDKFLNLFSDFVSENPFCTGVNWVDSSEAAIRLINILFSLSFFLFSSKTDAEVINSIINFSLHHSIFIENNLQYEKNRDHRYLINLLGLLSAGVFLQNSSYGKKNLHFARKGFEQEIRLQVFEDGVIRGQSLQFHAISLETFYLAQIIGGKAGIGFSSGYRSILKRMFTVQAAYLRTDGSIPASGDQSSSRILEINNLNKPDFSFLLPPGAMMFKDSGFKLKHPEITGELLFLFGLGARGEYAAITNSKNKNPHDKSAGFIKGGQFILKNRNIHFFIDAAELGKDVSGAHIDIFSFELFYKGKKIIVDPGTFSYYADKDIRNSLRSDKSHNIFCIDDEPISYPVGFFAINDDITKPKILEWESSDTEDILAAQHYAYTRLPDPVICKRSFHFLKNKSLLKIKDELFGGKKHKALFNITFHPEAELIQNSITEYTAANKDAKIKIRFHSSAEYFYSSVQDALYSEEYGCLNKTKKISTISEEKFPFFMVTEIELL